MNGKQSNLKGELIKLNTSKSRKSRDKALDIELERTLKLQNDHSYGIINYSNFYFQVLTLQSQVKSANIHATMYLVIMTLSLELKWL